MGWSPLGEVLGEVVPCCRVPSGLGEGREREVKRSVSSSLCEVFGGNAQRHLRAERA
jgi:hypothetical protein